MFVLLFGVLTALVQSALKAFLPPLALTALSGILELSRGRRARWRSLRSRRASSLRLPPCFSPSED